MSIDLKTSSSWIGLYATLLALRFPIDSTADGNFKHAKWPIRDETIQQALSILNSVLKFVTFVLFENWQASSCTEFMNIDAHSDIVRSLVGD